MAVELNHEKVNILRRNQECKDTVTISLNSDVRAKPGQFFMLYMSGLPDTGQSGEPYGKEKPFTVSGTSPLEFTIRKAGPFTKWAQTLGRRDCLEVTGPLGNSYADVFDPDAPEICLIAGGCGAAGMPYWAKWLADEYECSNVKVLLGAKTSEELLFADRFRDFCDEGNIMIATDDDSYENGIKGDVLELVRDAGIEDGSQIYVCGPRKMLIAVADQLCEEMEVTKPENVILTLEPYMKCGRGVCASCEVDGYHVCTDGPNFRYSVLADAEDFIEYRRSKSGKLIEL